MPSLTANAHFLKNPPHYSSELPTFHSSCKLSCCNLDFTKTHFPDSVFIDAMTLLKSFRRRRKAQDSNTAKERNKVYVAQNVTDEGCELFIIQQSEAREAHESGREKLQRRLSVDDHASNGAIPNKANRRRSTSVKRTGATGQDTEIIDVTPRSNAIMESQHNIPMLLGPNEIIWKRHAEATDVLSPNTKTNAQDKREHRAIVKYNEKIEMITKKHGDEKNFLFGVGSSDSLVSVATHASDSKSTTIDIDRAIEKEEAYEVRSLKTVDTVKTFDTGVTNYERSVSGYMDCIFLLGL